MSLDLCAFENKHGFRLVSHFEGGGDAHVNTVFLIETS